MAVKIEKTQPKPVSKWPADVVAYPFRGPRGLVTIVGPICLWLLNYGLTMVSAGVIGLVCKGVIIAGTCGYLSVYFLQVLGETAGGEDMPPDWPELPELWDQLFRVIGAVAVSFLPLIVLRIVEVCTDESGGKTTSSLYQTLYWPLAALGFLYFPMQLIAVALWEGGDAFKPVRILSSMFKCGWLYLCICATLLVVAYLGDQVIAALREVLPLMLASLAQIIIVFYLLMVLMRVLGLLYRLKEKRLGWFDLGQRPEEY